MDFRARGPNRFLAGIFMISPNLIIARDRFAAKGIPLGGAIALSAVLYYESKLDPGSQGHQSTERGGILNPYGAYGIPSLNGARQHALLDYATKHGVPVDELATQLDFVLTEMANHYSKSWAAVRSSESYKSIIPIIVNEYENPKDKQKEIDGALAIAGELAASLPQPAPPVPMMPAGLPPVSSTSAGRVASGADTLVALRTARVAELVSSDPEIVAYDAALAALGKITPMIVPAALPKPNATPVAPQRSNKMLGPNWVTSVFGTGSIAGAVATVILDLINKQPPDAASISLIFSSLMAGFGLVQAKDKNVTGGTVPQTKEAAARVTSPGQ